MFRAIERFEPYQITWGDSLSAGPFVFKTGDPEAPAVRFAVFNDIHERAALFDSLLVAGPLASLDRVILNGDMVNHVERLDQLFDGWIDTATTRFAQTVPFVFVRGNHETRGSLARSIPEILPPAHGRFFGVYHLGPVALVILDSGEDKPDSHWAYSGLTAFDAYREAQAAWLKQAVQSPAFQSAAFRVAVVHIPPLADDWHGTQEVERLFVPILAEAGLDLMIGAHTHQAMRFTGDAAPGFALLINDHQAGVWVEADADRLTARRIDVRGRVLDTLVLPKASPAPIPKKETL